MSKRKRIERMGAIDDLLEIDNDELMAQRRVLATKMERASSEYQEAFMAQTRINAALKAKRESDPNMFGVSDHAVLRYLQRYRGLDVKAVRDEIRKLALAKLDPNAPDQVLDFGDLKIAVSGGRSVTTIWMEKSPK